MYSFFNNPDVMTFGQYVVPIWGQLKTNIASQQNTIEMYYRNASFGCAASHYFVRVLQSIILPKTLSDVRYYENMLDLAMNHSMAMGMTSSIYKGTMHSNVLYGKGSEEVIIAVADEFDYVAAIANWKELQPVRVVRHPRSDLLLAPLDGRTEPTSNEKGVAVMIVNLPMLALQYRAFVMDEYEKLKASPTMQYATATIQQFVYRYIFTNTVRSHIDVALMNRLSLRLANLPAGVATRTLPIGLADYEARIDYTLNRVATQVDAGRMTLQAYLTHLPAINVGDQRECFLMPDIAPTRQVTWALNCAIEPLLRLYMRATDGQGARSNGVMMGQATRQLRSLSSDANYKQVLPSQSYLDYKQTLTDFVQMRK